MSATSTLDLIGPATIDDPMQAQARQLEALLATSAGAPDPGGQPWTTRLDRATRQNPELASGLHQVVLAAVHAWASGQPLLVATPKDDEVSTGEAAKMLGYTRSHIVNLINRGVLPARVPLDRPGTHRKVRVADVLAYQARMGQRTRMLMELAQLSADQDLDAIDVLVPPDRQQPD
jgi:excisionase family DNA binding protein